mgnify:CR=1 FL=1
MSREALPQRVAARSPLAERSHSGEVGQSWSAFLVLSHGGKALASPPRGLDLASAAAVLTRGACKNVADSTIYYHGLVRVDRVGLDHGREVVEVSAKVGDNLVMSATGLLAAPRTVYAFPGQGIQAKGMGMEGRTRCPAAREIWDRADKHTREALGFSILALVRDNPTEVTVRGEVHRHPDGVLYLTQFTQVAMACLAVAQRAELEADGLLVDGAYFAGHSIGEYDALAAICELREAASSHRHDARDEH